MYMKETLLKTLSELRKKRISKVVAAILLLGLLVIGFAHGIQVNAFDKYEIIKSTKHAKSFFF